MGGRAEAVLQIDRADSRERAPGDVQTTSRPTAQLVELGSLLNPLLNSRLPRARSLPRWTPEPPAQAPRARPSRASEAGGGTAVVVVHRGSALDGRELAGACPSSRGGARRGHATPLLLTARPGRPSSPDDARHPGRTRRAHRQPTRWPWSVRRSRLATCPAEIGEAIFAKTKGTPSSSRRSSTPCRRPASSRGSSTASSVTRAAELAALEIPDRVQGSCSCRA